MDAQIIIDLFISGLAYGSTLTAICWIIGYTISRLLSLMKGS